MAKLALVGKPNSGKSSLFNLLTGLNQKIANYSGATVDKKSGTFQQYEVVDLPGIKSMLTVSLDEKITKDAVLELSENKNPILFVAKAMQLSENLLLFSEIADLQIPSILLINFKDELEKNRIEIDLNKLSDWLGCPVILMNSRNGDGLADLEKAIKNNEFSIPNAICRNLYDKIEGDEIVNQYAEKIKQSNQDNNQLDANDFFKRQKIIGSLVRSVSADIFKGNSLLDRSKKWDRIFLHPVFGMLFFLLTMLVVFQSVFYLSSIPMDWIDMVFARLSEWTKDNITISWLADLISNGILPGLGGVLIFIPQIAILFLLLGILEHSGYLARISFISNRFLSNFGLSGQSVIPLMSSWACAIPAIMSARIISNPKERMALIFAAPLMTCSARLPVYTILIAIMFPSENTGFFNAQGLMLLALYLLGVLATLVLAWFMQRRSKIKSNNLWALELPVYRIPNWRNVLYNMYHKTKAFVVDAGKVIFVVSMVLWLLSSFSPRSQSFIEQQHETFNQQAKGEPLSIEAVELEYSYAGYLGKIIEPAIQPLGYDWKIGIALISSFAAREVFVGSLSTIYSVGSDEEALIKTRLKNEINQKTGEPRYNLATCVSLLLFYAFALQCMSTMAIVKKETGSWRYPIIQFVVMFVMAYVAAFIGYHIF